jgi:putative ABC transport system ATP-binding protein
MQGREGAAMGGSIEVRGVIKDYPLGKLTVRALHGIDLVIDRGEFTTIAGPSGSGETTLLNLIGCVDVPTAGDVLFDGVVTSTLSDKALTRLRLEKLGFIFQAQLSSPWVLSLGSGGHIPPSFTIA